ncbi:hypothetical protein B0T21DRAFT_395332 [Apiosordaria backusii]|uniref:Uncharacterized protein n=1 Tax=Apiosordaria backusii TaxID=314023 RepID=A0AA40AXQ0_9PEZI|nr:hypothetical protein B0T21DRAFT_395332 [Apiosordaria backusii]
MWRATSNGWLRPVTGSPYACFFSGGWFEANQNNAVSYSLISQPINMNLIEHHVLDVVDGQMRLEGSGAQVSQTCTMAGKGRHGRASGFLRQGPPVKRSDRGRFDSSLSRLPAAAATGSKPRRHSATIGDVESAEAERPGGTAGMRRAVRYHRAGSYLRRVSPQIQPSHLGLQPSIPGTCILHKPNLNFAAASIWSCCEKSVNIHFVYALNSLSAANTVRAELVRFPPQGPLKLIVNGVITLHHLIWCFGHMLFDVKTCADFGYLTRVLQASNGLSNFIHGSPLKGSTGLGPLRPEKTSEKSSVSDAHSDQIVALGL